ncbi:unnamed protein product [Toxocara canis]|uniref:guanylate cyclase n=1 Tax=Toxocara canis TaxID=6265 RepID=A0A183TYH2_TOXCA|nr:unnamed protein product [Toxocara canis]
MTITYKKQLNIVNNITMKDLLDNIKTRARIVVACLESDNERREFMKGVLSAQLNTSDYVYIFVETRKQGYGVNPFWIDRSDEKDNLDDEIKKACNQLLISPLSYPGSPGSCAASFQLDNQAINKSLIEFNQKVISRMKDYPFYCTIECENYTQASSQSPFLADAMYIYAKALNRTLTYYPSDGISNGSLIMAATEGNYSGYTGNVIIGKWANRNPIYMLFGMNINEQPEVFVVIPTTGNSSEWLPKYTDATNSIWALRGGFRPVSHPKCGFIGAECPPSFMETNFVYVMVAAVFFVFMVVFVIAVGIYLFRLKTKERERLDQLWQIDYTSLVKHLEKTEASKSKRSVQSTNISMSGQTTFERINETATLSFYYLYQEPVVAKKHSARPRIEKKEAAELRMLSQMVHDNLNKFIGLCINGPQYMSVWKFCSRGSIKGLYAIHRSSIGCHGHLTSSVCLVDERWQVKISNFGLDFIKAAEQRPNTTLLWTAPEHLRENNNVGSKQGDVYSFAIICSEIITRKSAFQMIENGQTVEGLFDAFILFRVSMIT